MHMHAAAKQDYHWHWLTASYGTLINPPQVRARVSWPALLKVLAVMLVMTAAYKLFILAASFLKLSAPCRARHYTGTHTRRAAMMHSSRRSKHAYNGWGASLTLPVSTVRTQR